MDAYFVQVHEHYKLAIGRELILPIATVDDFKANTGFLKRDFERYLESSEYAFCELYHALLLDPRKPTRVVFKSKPSEFSRARMSVIRTYALGSHLNSLLYEPELHPRISIAALKEHEVIEQTVEELPSRAFDFMQELQRFQEIREKIGRAHV